MTVRIEAPERSVGVIDTQEISVHDVLLQFEAELSRQDLSDEKQFPDPTPLDIEAAGLFETTLEQDEPSDGDNTQTSVDIAGDDMPQTIHPLDLYLAEISRFPKLTTKEKEFHIDRFTAGRHALSVLSIPRKRSEKRTMELKQQAENGWISRNVLIETHLPLVVSIAKKYRDRGVPFLDLINAGNIGLIRSLYKFDPKRKHALSTYATFWIRQAVLKEISDSSRTIHMAENTENDVAAMVYMVNRFHIEHDREPTVEEIALALGKKPSRIRELQEQMKQPISMETSVGDADETELGEFVTYPDEPSVEASVSMRLFQSLFAEVLKSLTAQERKAISLLYRADNKTVSIREIARNMRIPEYEAKQILKRAKNKIATHANADALHDFLV